MIGSKIPNVPLQMLNAAKGLQSVSSHEIFANKRAVIFSLPGAFTPTCSTTHVPKYLEYKSLFKKEGVDSISCLSVNDAFVMDAWRKDQGISDEIQFLADGNGAFTDGMGMLVDKSAIGFGKRSWRYSALIEDLTVVAVFSEPQVEGDPFEVSDAETMLRHLNPAIEIPQPFTLLVRKGCPHCAEAVRTLDERQMPYYTIPVTSGGSISDGSIPMSSLESMTGGSTVPQIFHKGKLVGGCDDLKAYL